MSTEKLGNKPQYNEIKTTQTAVLLLKLNNGHMNYMKLIKLLYNIDREALGRWARPITYDEYYALPHGMVVSKTLDKVKQRFVIRKSYWNQYIRRHNLDSVLLSDSGADELSPAEIELIEEIFEKYREKDQWDMEDEHHRHFSEWENPRGSHIHKDYTATLRALDFSEDDIIEIVNEIKELSLLEALG